MSGPAGRAALVWLPRVLADVVVLYALQTLYSADFSKGLQNVCFFFVPFTLVYALLREVEWDRRLLTLVLWVVAVEAVAFVLVGSVEYLSRSLFWNDQVIRSNEFHTYFRVNSVFWDPNVYGRYLALVIVVAWRRCCGRATAARLALLTALVGVLWIGLAPTFSQSSFAALLAGLAVLAALRWSLRWTLAAVAVGLVAGLLVVTLAGGSVEAQLRPHQHRHQRPRQPGLRRHPPLRPAPGLRLRLGLASHGLPRARPNPRVPVSVSHTEPITVAAEQGLVGLAAYGALVLAALLTMGAGILAPATGGPARAAVLAAFVALLVHTMAYAGFFEDPITWVLLAVAASLAAAPVRDSARVHPCRDTCAAWRRPAPPTPRRASSRRSSRSPCCRSTRGT